MEGYLKLYRKIEEWEWYTEANTFRLFMHLLIRANIKDSKWRGFDVKRGSLITGRKQLAKELNLTESQIRTALNNLQTTNEIAIKSTNTFSVVEVINWEDYQLESPTKRQQPRHRIATAGEEEEYVNIESKKAGVIKKTKQQYYQDELNRITDPKLRESLEKWWIYKKGKYEEIGWQSQITIVLKFPAQQVIDRIEEAIASGWQGMNLDKISANGKKMPSVEFFGLLEGYNEEIQIKTRNKLKDYSGFQRKEASPDVVRTYLNEAIVDYEKTHMPEESKKLVREMSETWRKDNNLSSYQDVPNSVIVEFIKKVKENGK